MVIIVVDCGSVYSVDVSATRVDLDFNLSDSAKTPFSYFSNEAPSYLLSFFCRRILSAS